MVVQFCLPASNKDEFCSTSLPAFSAVSGFHLYHSNRYVLVSHFNLQFLNNNVNHLFICLSSVYLLWWDVKVICPFFNRIHFLTAFYAIFILDNSPLSNVPFANISPSLFFTEQKLSILMKSSLSITSFVDRTLYLKVVIPRPSRFSPQLSSKNFAIIHFTFRLMTILS